MSARERAREGEGERARRRSNAPSYECGVGKAPRSESSDSVQSCSVLCGVTCGRYTVELVSEHAKCGDVSSV